MAEAVAEPEAEPLHLTLVPPKGASHAELTMDPAATGQDLKLRVQEVTGVAPESQLLFFQNGSRNAAKTVVDSSLTLAAQGIEDAATITLRLNEECVLPENSVLRQSIRKNGGSSYYYAHANESALPPEHRYVYGGAPAKLGEADPQIALQQAAHAIKKYSWADEGDFVCIYIDAEAEAEAVKEAADGRNGEVKVEFGPKSVELRIQRDAREFAFILRNLENEVVPEDCKHRISAGKRITLKLKKKRQGTWTRLVKPQK